MQATIAKPTAHPETQAKPLTEIQGASESEIPTSPPQSATDLKASSLLDKKTSPTFNRRAKTRPTVEKTQFHSAATREDIQARLRSPFPSRTPRPVVSPPELTKARQAGVSINIARQRVQTQWIAGRDINNLQVYDYRGVNFTDGSSLKQVSKGLRAIRDELKKAHQNNVITLQVAQEIGQQLTKAAQATSSPQPEAAVIRNYIGEASKVVEREIMRQVPQVAKEFTEVVQEAKTLGLEEQVQDLMNWGEGLQGLMGELVKAGHTLEGAEKELTKAVQAVSKLEPKRRVIRQVARKKKTVQSRISGLGVLIMGIVALAGMWADLGVATGIILALLAPSAVKSEEAG